MIDIETRSTWWERTLAFPQLWESSTRARFQDWLFCSIRILNIEPPESFVPIILILSSRPSMSSLRSLTSPPQASRSELFSNSTLETFQHFTALSVPQVRYLKIIEKSGYQVSLNTGRINQFARRTHETSQNMFLHFSLSWPTRNWNLRRESYI